MRVPIELPGESVPPALMVSRCRMVPLPPTVAAGIDGRGRSRLAIEPFTDERAGVDRGGTGIGVGAR